MNGLSWKAARALAAVALAGLAAGCAGQGVMGTRSADRPPEDVRELRSRVLELQRQAAVTEVELERLRRKVAELEARLEGRPVPRSTPPSAVPAPPPSASARRGPEVEVEDLSDDSPRRPPPSPPSPSTTPPRAVEETPAGDRVRPRPPAPAAGAGAAEVTAEAQALYDRGYTLYHQGRYVDAESSFRRFLQGYPATELSDNAQYWIGECRLARGDVSGALAAFRETVERYPDGNKVPDALLKVGEAMAALGDVEGAREAYREVARRFAGTTAAAVAQDRLRALP